MLLTLGASAFGPVGGDSAAASGGGVSLADYATAATAAGPVDAVTAVRLVVSS